MLSFQEKERLRGQFPTEYTIEWKGSEYKYEVPVWWSKQDAEGEIPSLILAWGVQDEQTPARQPLNQLKGYHPTSGTKIEREDIVACVAELEVYLKVKIGRDENKVPQEVRASNILGTITRQFRFEVDMNEVGEDGERPVLHRFNTAPAPLGTESKKKRVYQFTLNLYYNEERSKKQETVEKVEWEVT